MNKNKSSENENRNQDNFGNGNKEQIEQDLQRELEENDSSVQETDNSNQKNTNKDEKEKEKENENIKTELEKVKESLIRSHAEMENLRKRTIKEKEEAIKFAITNFARDMLSISDNLNRAFEAVEGKEIPKELQPFIDGIKLTEQELSKTLKKHGVEKIDSLGKKLNPDYHQVLFEIDMDAKDETTKNLPKNIKEGDVAKVFQDGYLLRGRLLRPAMVGVLKNKNKNKDKN